MFKAITLFIVLVFAVPAFALDGAHPPALATPAPPAPPTYFFVFFFFFLFFFFFFF